MASEDHAVHMDRMDRITEFLRENGPSKTLAIAKAVLGPEGTKRKINPTLYRMDNLVCEGETKKVWRLKDLDS